MFFQQRQHYYESSSATLASWAPPAPPHAMALVRSKSTAVDPININSPLPYHSKQQKGSRVKSGKKITGQEHTPFLNKVERFETT